MLKNRREYFRKGLHDLYLPYYDALCEELSEDWQPFYGLRSFDEQAEIYAQGRTKPGKIVTKAPPGASPHNYGMASDWTIFDGNGNPTWINKLDVRLKPYIDACLKVGVQPGALFRSIPDFDHNELKIDISWGQVKQAFDDKGMAGAIEFIKEHQVK